MKSKNKLLYTAPTERVISIGTYRQIRYAVLSIEGKYPAAYVENFNNKDSSKFPIDHKITFNDVCYWNCDDVHKYYGWKYNSTNDYTTYYAVDQYPELNMVYIDINKNAHKYTYDEIIEEIHKVIDYLLD